MHNIQFHQEKNGYFDRFSQSFFITRLVSNEQEYKKRKKKKPRKKNYFYIFF
jgi:hypothetical protein